MYPLISVYRAILLLALCLCSLNCSANNPRFQNLARVTHTLASTGAVLDDHEFTYNKTQSKSSRKDVRTGGPGTSWDFSYDSLQRITSTVKTQNAVPATITYALDLAGNRTSVTGGSVPGTYTSTSSPASDKEVNQYTSTPRGAAEYDANGNFVAEFSTPARTLQYDDENRLRGVNYPSDPYKTATYTYDAFDRLISRTQQRTSSLTVTDNYYYSGWELVEEQSSNNATRTFVYGDTTDELVQIVVNATAVYYAHHSDLNTVSSLTDATGAVTQRVSYEEFGRPSFFNASGQLLTMVGLHHAFTGRLYDPATRLYDYRSRWYDPQLGRFTNRDTIGSWGDPINLGNGYTYVGNNPGTHTDPFGEKVWWNPTTWADPWVDTKHFLGRGSGDDVKHFREGGRRGGMGFLDAMLPGVQGDRCSKEHQWGRMVGQWTVAIETAIGGGVAAKVATKGARVVAGMRAGKAATASDDIYVIGRHFDTKIAQDWAGHKVLNIRNWSIPKNDAWVKNIIRERARVYLASPQTRKNLWDNYHNRERVFARELRQLMAAGYKQVGDYLLPGI